jgi:hypothetical protein
VNALRTGRYESLKCFKCKPFVLDFTHLAYMKNILTLVIRFSTAVALKCALLVEYEVNRQYRTAQSFFR